MRTAELDFFTAQPLSPKDAGNVLPAAFAYQMEQYQALVPINPADVETVTIPDIVVVRRDRSATHSARKSHRSRTASRSWRFACSGT